MAYHARFTIKRKNEFLDSLRKGSSICSAIKPLLISRRAIYNQRENDKEFAAEWDRALEDGTDKLEDEARRRAYEGVDEPVFYKGDECGVVRKYSDTLLIFLLKGARPDKYRETDQVNVHVNDRVLNLHIDLAAAKADNILTLPSHVIEGEEVTAHALDQVSSVGQVEGQVGDPTPSTLRPNRKTGVGGE